MHNFLRNIALLFVALAAVYEVNLLADPPGIPSTVAGISAGLAQQDGGIFITPHTPGDAFVSGSKIVTVAGALHTGTDAYAGAGVSINAGGQIVSTKVPMTSAATDSSFLASPAGCNGPVFGGVVGGATVAYIYCDGTAYFLGAVTASAIVMTENTAALPACSAGRNATSAFRYKAGTGSGTCVCGRNAGGAYVYTVAAPAGTFAAGDC